MKILITINLLDLAIMLLNVGLDIKLHLPQERLNNDLNYLVANTGAQLTAIFFFATILSGINKLTIQYQTFSNVMAHVSPAEMLSVLAIMGLSFAVSSVCALGTLNKTINILKLNSKMRKQMIY